MTRKYTEAVKNANRTWDSNNLDRLSIAIPKGNKEVIIAHCGTTGESVNKFIQRAIQETIARDKESTEE